MICFYSLHIIKAILNDTNTMNLHMVQIKVVVMLKKHLKQYY